MAQHLLTFEQKTKEDEMKPIESPLRNPTDWQLIFLQSKVNGAAYNGEMLERQNWDWPRDTYFQRRLRSIKFDYHKHNSPA